MSTEARWWLYAAAFTALGLLLIATPTALNRYTRKEIPSGRP